MADRKIVGELDAKDADEMMILRMAAPKRIVAETGAA